MHLAGLGSVEVETFEDLAAIDIDVKVLDLKHYDVSLTRFDIDSDSSFRRR